MSKKLFIGNIEWNATEEDLRTLFEGIGPVEEVQIIQDKFSGRSKGFGFVTFTNAEDADRAISELDGHDLNGRELHVNEARPRKD